MGDRCYLEVDVLARDANKLNQFIFGEFDEGAELDKLITITAVECNYGCAEPRQEAAAAGICFIGWHTEGACYPGMRFASDGHTLDERMTAGDGELVIGCNADGSPRETEIKASMEFVAFEKSVRASLEG